MPLKNEKLNEYVKTNLQKLVQLGYETVTELLNNSIVLKHSFKPYYYTISMTHKGTPIIIKEQFGGGGLRRLHSEILKEL